MAGELEDVWLRHLRYGYWEAHLLRVTPTSVRLDVATQVSQNGYYITGAVIATWSEPAAVTHE